MLLPAGTFAGSLVHGCSVALSDKNQKSMEISCCLHEQATSKSLQWKKNSDFCLSEILEALTLAEKLKPIDIILFVK
jgi:hypothetical protein